MVIKIIKKGNSISEKPLKPSAAVLVSNDLIERATGIKNFHNVKVKKVPKKRDPTPLQARVIKIVKSGGLGRKSKAQILREAGASASVIDKPGKVFDSPTVVDAIKPVINKMRKIRTKVLDSLEKKDMDKQSAYNLVLISSILTKDSELLDGRPTDRMEFELPEEEKARLDKILKMNS